MPDLSVIVPSVNGLPRLRECLDALAATPAHVRLQVIVIDRCGDGLRRTVRRDYADAVVIAVATGTSIPRMRELGFGRATAEAIAVIEDHVIVPPHWARQLLDALSPGIDVVAGSVSNGATEHVVDWAAFLCEYSHLLPPLPAGPSDTLTGNNVVYRRAVVHAHWDAIAAGRWEDHVHETMRRAGVTLVCRPDISVQHKMHYRTGEYLSQRYLYARAYAGLRRAQMTPARRALYAAAAAGLPPVLLLRVVARVASRRAFVVPLAQSLPLLALFVTAWAVGESVGYAAGPGDALSRVA